jgi:3-oxoadipate enol-lactonase
LAGRGTTFVRELPGPPGAPTIALLHGWTATADLNWFTAFRSLGRRFRVVAMDHRGHGRGIRSSKPFRLTDCADDVVALADLLGIERIIPVGYSMGGPIALLLWQRHPELVRALVLEATAMEFSADRRERRTWGFMGPVAFLLRWDAGRYALLRLMDLQSGHLGESGGRDGTSIPPEMARLRAWAEGEFRRGDPTDLAEAGRALGRFDARPFAATIDVPAAVVVTTRDQLVPTWKQRELARTIGARTFDFDGDHDAVAMGGQAFAAVTLEAIASVASARPRPGVAGRGQADQPSGRASIR